MTWDPIKWYEGFTKVRQSLRNQGAPDTDETTQKALDAYRALQSSTDQNLSRPAPSSTSTSLREGQQLQGLIGDGVQQTREAVQGTWKDMLPVRAGYENLRVGTADRLTDINDRSYQRSVQASTQGYGGLLGQAYNQANTRQAGMSSDLRYLADQNFALRNRQLDVGEKLATHRSPVGFRDIAQLLLQGAGVLALFRS